MAIETPPAASAAPARSVRSEGARTDASRAGASTDNAFASLLGAAEEEEGGLPDAPAERPPQGGRLPAVATDAVAVDAAALAGAQAVADAAGAELAQGAQAAGATGAAAADGSALSRAGAARRGTAQGLAPAGADTDGKLRSPTVADLPVDPMQASESDARTALDSGANGVRGTGTAAEAARRASVAEGRDPAKAGGGARVASTASGYNSILAQMQHAMSRGSAAAAVDSSTAVAAAAAAKAGGGATAELRLADRATGDTVLGLGLVEAAPALALAAAFEGAGGAGARGERHAAAGEGGAAGTAAPGGFGSTADAASWRTLSEASGPDATAANGAAASAEDQVADQVRYWVSQKTQSAELTLDAFGGVPVDVRISLTGSEAHVAFQSDQAETRQMLGGATHELREMLQREGLTLSGVSVGGSDARGNDNGNGSARPDPREGGGRSGRQTVLTAVDGVAGATRRAAATGSGPGRSLDLFV